MNQINNTTKRGQRCNVVNDKALGHLNGKLRCRFVYGGLERLRHTATETSNDPLCKLHIWKFGKKNKKSEHKCGVTICANCFFENDMP